MSVKLVSIVRWTYSVLVDEFTLENVLSRPAEDRLIWDTYNNTQYHTPYAKMTSLSIRLTVPLREVIRGGALAQWTAAARASCDRHVHSPCPCALQATNRAAALVFVATVTSHSGRSTRRARVRARAPAEDRRVPPDAPPEGNAKVARW